MLSVLSVMVRKIGRVALAVLVVLFAAAAALSPAGNAYAQADQPGWTGSRTVTVVGEGKTTIKPDLARATIGVEVANASVKEASAENRATLEAVLEALKAQGIADKDIQTSGFSVYAERYGPEGPLSDSDVRYRVSNNVSVKIRDLERVGEVLDAAIDAGANNIYGVDFSLEDMEAARSRAREHAVANAAVKAEELAELAGVTLGPIVSLSEIIGAAGGFYSGILTSAQGLGGGGGAPISPGELEVIYQIQAVYSIAE